MTRPDPAEAHARQRPDRIADHAVDGQFLDRWSGRAFTGEPLPVETLLSFFEAARWAPSAMNAQPWRFIYALPGAEAWPAFAGVLAASNQPWCEQASALVIIGSKTTLTKDERTFPSPCHAFDAGAAWMSLALQATLSGWQAHAMAGFDRDRARQVVAAPDDVELHAMIAIGRSFPSDHAAHDRDLLTLSASRRPVEAFAIEGTFPPEPR